MIAITGATGFVGTQVLRALGEQNSQLRLIVREGKSLVLKNEKFGFEIVETPDLFCEKRENLEQMLAGVHTLVHAAWYTEPGKYPDSAVNLDCLRGSIELVKAFAAVGGRRFVGLGTCAECDLSEGRIGTAAPLNPTNLYAACKAALYQVLKQYLPPRSIEFAWCRLFYLYGKGEDDRRLVPYIRKQLEAGKTAELSSGTQIRDYLDVQEAGRMISDVALGTDQGALNICSGVPVSIRQLAESVGREYGRLDLLKFGARADNPFDPAFIVGIRDK